MFIAAVLGVLAGIRRIDFQPVIERHALSVATYAIGTLMCFTPSPIPLRSADGADMPAAGRD